MILQKLHKVMSTRMSILPLCLLILFVTTSIQAAPVSASIFNDADATSEYSGEELFRGIYFSQGPVADRITLLQSFDLNRFVKDEAKRNKVLDFQDQVMAKIVDENGEFLDELVTSVATRNNFKIKNTLMKGNELLMDVAHEISGHERNLQKEAAFKAEVAKNVDLNKASAEEVGNALEQMASNAIVIDYWVMMPICIVIVAMCAVAVMQIAWVANAELSEHSLFQEQIIVEISKL